MKPVDWTDPTKLVLARLSAEQLRILGLISEAECHRIIEAAKLYAEYAPKIAASKGEMV